MKRLVLLSLILLLAVPVFAQGPAFQVTSLPRQMRGEGITETAGDIVLIATGAAGATSTIKAGSSINIVYSATVTSLPTDPLTILKAQNGATALTAANVSITSAGNQVTISFITDVSLTTGQGYSITNVRVNASTATGGQVTAFISGNSSVPATNPITFTNPQVIVGIVVKPSFTSLTGLSPDKDVETFGTSLSLTTCAGGTAHLRAAITENYPSAFTTTAQEVSLTPDQADKITNGTIFQVVLHNVPSGVTVTLTPLLTATGGGSADPVVTSGTALVTAAGTVSGTTYDLTTNANIGNVIGAGTASAGTGNSNGGSDKTFFVYFTATDLSVSEDLVLDFGVSVAAGSAALSSTAAMTADVSLVPGPSTSTANHLSPIVRFQTTPLGTFTIGTVGNCTTTILFPFVAGNVVGFDTSIALSNTGKDPFDTSSQGGTCTVTVYPSDLAGASTGAPIEAVVTPTIAPGGVYATSLGSLPTFGTGHAGYAFAVCNFLYAHGYAIITNGFGQPSAQPVSHGYLGLIVNPTNAGRPTQAAESLGF